MELNRGTEPAYAGVGLTFSRTPLVLRPEDLVGADVAIVGAPIDETTVVRPGARYGPRAIRQADPSGAPPSRHHMDLGVDPFEVLTVVDHGDAEVVPADPARSHEAIRGAVRDVMAAGAVPLVLGGDHSILHPDAGAAAEALRPASLGVIHFDAHADDAEHLYGVRRSHGTPVRLLVEEGAVRGEHIVQVGLRGYWPGPEEFAWARERGLVWFTQGEIDERGFDAVMDDVIEIARAPDHLWLSVDIDVVDPGAAPGTGAPEPGGLQPRELLAAVRRIAVELGFAGMEVVEVSPPYDHAEVTALLANRVVLEALSGLALRRLGGEPRPERPARGGPDFSSADRRGP
ncbi:MAG TPA: agmatinase family protein [Actinomycetota bacterium]|nr:agmatinase family protein [Actinomycetota bacterium]